MALWKTAFNGLAALCVSAASAVAQDPVQCRLALAIGMDVSGSVDRVEYRLQMDGLANALLNPEVQRQVLQSPETPIYLSAFEWAGRTNQRLIFNWTALDSPEAIADLANTLRKAERVMGPNDTAIGAAMIAGEELFNRLPGCWRYTLDLSGDGTNNNGPEPDVARANLPGRTINGLVVALDLTVGRDERQMELMALSAYFRKNVIQGPDAFIEIALGFSDFERAMTRKLLRETETLMLGMGARPHETLTE